MDVYEGAFIGIYASVYKCIHLLLYLIKKITISAHYLVMIFELWE